MFNASKISTSSSSGQSVETTSNFDYSKRGVKSQIDLKKQNISQKHAHSDQYIIICDLYHRITNSKSRCIKYIHSEFEYYSALIVLAPKSF